MAEEKKDEKHFSCCDSFECSSEKFAEIIKQCCGDAEDCDCKGFLQKMCCPGNST